uniref:ABC transporter domain-containing protein n=1 Tax=Megaselia scalaris TaxID=36166 RepID=T1GPL7_MEGSC
AVYLDEPTAGIDPKSKKQIWNAISAARNRGIVIVISTNSMEESEVLCTTLGIIVGGELKCIGSPQHLKNRFSTGFTLQLRMIGNSVSFSTAYNFSTTNTRESKLIGPQFSRDSFGNQYDFETVKESLSFAFPGCTLKKLGDCSVGTQRKVNTAAAFINCPSAVYLDEPTAGIDPKSKRQIWNAISAARNRGIVIVISTNSMEESEVLCTTLGIVVGGELKCIGSPQHLKNRFSTGFTLQLRMIGNKESFVQFKLLSGKLGDIIIKNKSRIISEDSLKANKDGEDQYEDAIPG